MLPVQQTRCWWLDVAIVLDVVDMNFAGRERRARRQPCSLGRVRAGSRCSWRPGGVCRPNPTRSYLQTWLQAPTPLQKLQRLLTELSSLRYRMPVAGQWSQSSIISLLTTDSSVRIQSCSCESRNQVTTKPRIRLSAAKCLIILTATPKFSHRISTIPATWQGYGWGQGATCTPCYAGTPA